jgi:4-hydroxy-tetrahydrodipicolinate synthase
MANVVDGAEKFQGAMVASVTPFNRNGSVDYPALEELIEFFVCKGIDAIVPCGTTGESSGMSHEVHGRVIEKVVEYSNGRVPVLAGTGSNITKEAVRRTKHARDAGADGALIVEPYYNRPQERNVVGLYYQPIAQEVPGFPLIAYHVPSRTGGRFSVYTPLQLARIPEFVGIKFANSDLNLAREIMSKVYDDLMLFSGEDALNLDFYRMGAKGAISVTANVVPDLVADVYRMYSSGNYQGAEFLQSKLQELNTAMFVAGNPDSVKTALHMMGMIKPYAIAPVGFAEGEKKDTIREALERMEIHIINNE